MPCLRKLLAAAKTGFCWLNGNYSSAESLPDNITRITHFPSLLFSGLRTCIFQVARG